jgi:Arc/MetJ-type ribon-helix-helix transcriptional regulator
MQTIAITIDEDLLRGLDKLGRRGSRANRSELIRRAVRLLLDTVARNEREESERIVIHRNRKRFNLEAAALIADQAEQ